MPLQAQQRTNTVASGIAFHRRVSRSRGLSMRSFRCFAAHLPGPRGQTSCVASRGQAVLGYNSMD
jgi:hypothetical protein